MLSGSILNRECRFDLFISGPGPYSQPIPINALIDTGCTGIAIRPDVATAARLKIIGSIPVRTPTGTQASPVAIAKLHLHSHGKTLSAVVQVVIQQNMADPMLFGMRGLMGGTLRVDTITGEWEIRIKKFGSTPT